MSFGTQRGLEAGWFPLPILLLPSPSGAPGAPEELTSRLPDWVAANWAVAAVTVSLTILLTVASSMTINV